jgi:hypothetical protein
MKRDLSILLNEQSSIQLSKDIIGKNDFGPFDFGSAGLGGGSR